MRVTMSWAYLVGFIVITAGCGGRVPEDEGPDPIVGSEKRIATVVAGEDAPRRRYDAPPKRFTPRKLYLAEQHV